VERRPVAVWEALAMQGIRVRRDVFLAAFQAIELRLDLGETLKDQLVAPGWYHPVVVHGVSPPADSALPRNHRGGAPPY
jgi:hypothetical protein